MSCDNVSFITKNALCTGCGSCVGICPSAAIKMTETVSGFLVAEVDEVNCQRCEECIAVCPSNKDNFSNVVDFIHGICISGYIGHASDFSVRGRTQSGGIVTALLCYLLDSGEIDGAVVTNFNPEKRRPEAIFTSSRKVVEDSCGSYYSQTAVVKTILENPGKDVAAVVLGCQAEGLKLISENHPGIEIPKVLIGLVCAGQHSGLIIDDLINQAGCSNKKVTGFRFRDKDGGGWPGDVKVSTSDGDHWLDKQKRHALKKVYEHPRCILCYDQMNIYSDIVCGDPWGIGDIDSSAGFSVVIARTKRGNELLKRASTAGYISVEPLEISLIMDGQTVDGRHVKKSYLAMEECKQRGWVTPYPDNMFENIPISMTTNAEISDIRERMRYARALYSAGSTESVCALVSSRKKKLSKLTTRRIIGYSVRRLKAFLKLSES